MDEYLGVVKLFAGNFAPRGWAFCDGSLLSINQNTALFSLLGTTYGGNGTTTFGLPDLRGRVPVGAGNGTGIPPVVAGQLAGEASTTLSTQNLPPHTHAVVAVSESGGTGNPQGAYLAATGSLDPEYRTTGTKVSMATDSTASIGSGQPFTNMPPFQGMNYIICLSGIYPSRP